MNFGTRVVMPEYENILSFRRLEPTVPAADPLVTSRPELAEGPVHNRSAANDAPPDRCVVPWAKRTAPRPFDWHDLSDERPLLSVRIRLGKTLLSRGDAYPLTCGSIVTLDRAADEPVEIVVEGRVVALGRIVVAPNNKLAVEVCQLRRTSRAGAA
jgi:hypothetical protein